MVYPLSLLGLFVLISIFVALLNIINLSFYFCRSLASGSANPATAKRKEKCGDKRCCKNSHNGFHPKLRVVITNCLVYIAAIISDALLNK